MANIIKNDNRKILNECLTTDNRKACNCRNKDLCHLDGKCLTNSVIYEATVTAASGTTSNYIGMAENDGKQDSTTTNSLLGTETTHMTQFFQNTTGN